MKALKIYMLLFQIVKETIQVNTTNSKILYYYYDSHLTGEWRGAQRKTITWTHFLSSWCTDQRERYDGDGDGAEDAGGRGGGDAPDAGAGRDPVEILRRLRIARPQGGGRGAAPPPLLLLRTSSPPRTIFSLFDL